MAELQRGFLTGKGAHVVAKIKQADSNIRQAMLQVVDMIYDAADTIEAGWQEGQSHYRNKTDYIYSLSFVSEISERSLWWYLQVQKNKPAIEQERAKGRILDTKALKAICCKPKPVQQLSYLPPGWEDSGKGFHKNKYSVMNIDGAWGLFKASSPGPGRDFLESFKTSAEAMQKADDLLRQEAEEKAQEKQRAPYGSQTHNFAGKARCVDRSADEKSWNAGPNEIAKVGRKYEVYGIDPGVVVSYPSLEDAKDAAQERHDEKDQAQDFQSDWKIEDGVRTNGPYRIKPEPVEGRRAWWRLFFYDPENNDLPLDMGRYERPSEAAKEAEEHAICKTERAKLKAQPNPASMTTWKKKGNRWTAGEYTILRSPGIGENSYKLFVGDGVGSAFLATHRSLQAAQDAATEHYHERNKAHQEPEQKKLPTWENQHVRPKTWKAGEYRIIKRRGDVKGNPFSLSHDEEDLGDFPNFDVAHNAALEHLNKPKDAVIERPEDAGQEEPEDQAPRLDGWQRHDWDQENHWDKQTNQDYTILHTKANRWELFGPDEKLISWHCLSVDAKNAALVHYQQAQKQPTEGDGWKTVEEGNGDRTHSLGAFEVKEWTENKLTWFEIRPGCVKECADLDDAKETVEALVAGGWDYDMEADNGQFRRGDWVIRPRQIKKHTHHQDLKWEAQRGTQVPQLYSTLLMAVQHTDQEDEPDEVDRLPEGWALYADEAENEPDNMVRYWFPTLEEAQCKSKELCGHNLTWEWDEGECRWENTNDVDKIGGWGFTVYQEDKVNEEWGRNEALLRRLKDEGWTLNVGRYTKGKFEIVLLSNGRQWRLNVDGKPRPIVFESFEAALEVVTFMEAKYHNVIDQSEPLTLLKIEFETPYQMAIVLVDGRRLTFVGETEGTNLTRKTTKAIAKLEESKASC